VFRIRPDQLETLHDVVAMLELRIGVETEAAGLAALRRTADNLAAMRRSLIAFTQAVEAGRDAVVPDFQFHLEIARATQNPHFSSLFQSLGTPTIPRARLDPSSASNDERQAYLRRVNAEHGSILDAIEGHDGEAARAAMRTHLANSRERRRRAAQLADS
jgi:GntR family transcriptional repressor for pyruvate dehydrogenase complex